MCHLDNIQALYIVSSSNHAKNFAIFCGYVFYINISDSVSKFHLS